MRHMFHGAGLALAVLALAGTAQAQRIGGNGGGTGGTGGTGGASSGGFVGTGGFGSSSSGGGNTGGGGFVGSGGFGSGTGNTGGGGFVGSGSGTGGTATTGGARGGATGGASGSTPSNAGPFAKYMYNPVAIGFQQGTSGQTAAIANAAGTVKPYPTTSTFGQPLYAGTNTATVGRSGVGGTTGGLGGRGGQALGGQGLGGVAGQFNGATTAGIRRAPAFTTQIRFDRTPVRPVVTMRPQLTSAIANSTRLPSRERIQVAVDGNAVVLSGPVKDLREKRLAELIVRMTPGVGEIRNELIPESNTDD